MKKDLTKQEELFIERAYLKQLARPELTFLEAAREVCDDDRRIEEMLTAMPDRQKAELVSGLSQIVYGRIRQQQKGA